MRQKKGLNVFSEALKLEVIEGLKDGRYTISEALKKYGIGSASTVYKWQVKYGSVKPKVKQGGGGAMSRARDTTNTGMTTEEIIAMKKDNRRMYLENLLFKAHIELLEEEHGVEGLKKRIPLAKLEEYERNRVFLRL